MVPTKQTVDLNVAYSRFDFGPSFARHTWVPKRSAAVIVVEHLRDERTPYTVDDSRADIQDCCILSCWFVRHRHMEDMPMKV